MASRLVFTLALALLGGCGDPEPAAKAPAAKEPAQKTFNASMAEHFSYATSARTAVINGDLAAAKKEMVALVAMESPEGLPQAWEPHMASMKRAAEAAAVAEDLDAMAQDVARVGVVCGACHATTGGGPTAAVTSAKAEEAPETSHMQRHLWSADRMWLGLIGPSSELFNSGAEALVHTELYEGKAAAEERAWIFELQELDSMRRRPEEFRVMEAQIHDLADMAKAADTPVKRAAVYGQFTATCARCHGLFRNK